MDKVFDIFGIMGIIDLPALSYAVVITQREDAGVILGQKIYRARDFALIPFSGSASSEKSTSSILSTGKAVKATTGLPDIDRPYLELIRDHLDGGPFYFSPSYDITHSMERIHGLKSKSRSSNLWERADDRFFWNRFISNRLIDAAQSGSGQAEIGAFILPCIFGIFQLRFGTVNGRRFLFGMISRRSRFRAGTRFFSRGMDHQGNVSNFNETEQVVLMESGSGSGTDNRPELTSSTVPGIAKGTTGPSLITPIQFSHVQIRGSVPLFWAQLNNLKYQPKLQVMEMSDTQEAMQRHFEDMVKHYRVVRCINLVNADGYESPVKNAFESGIEKMGDDRVRYTYFDFHHVCKGMRFDRVRTLLDDLEKEFIEQAYFAHDEGNQSLGSEQKSVYRTNCMDCLDRTNVVQSTFACSALERQFASVGVLEKGERLDSGKYEDFMFLYRNLWADHADAISKAYSGTGALKTDFTRYGIRTKKGALQDFVNSAVRYGKNNYHDGFRQDAYDLFTGNANAKSMGRQPFIDQRSVLKRSVPFVMFFSMAMLFFATIGPPRGPAGRSRPDHQVMGVPLEAPGSESSHHFIFVAFWISAMVSALTFIIRHGQDYVFWPRLVPLDDVRFYKGKLFASPRGNQKKVPHVLKGSAKDAFNE